MFEGIVKLFTNFKLFIKGQPYDYEHSTLDVSQYFKKHQDMESIVTQKSYKTIKSELERIQHPADYKKVLLHSMNDTLAKYSIPAVENLRRYIDHTLLDLSTQAERNQMGFNVHNAIIPLCGV